MKLNLKKLVGLLIVIGFTFGVTTVCFSSSKDIKLKATEYITKLLRDPDSAKFRNVKIVDEDYVCGEVKAKNGYGGYTGFTRFAWSSDLGGYGFVEDDEPSDDPMIRAMKTVLFRSCKMIK